MMHDIGRDTSSVSDDDMSDGTWMTYADLAALRGINHASAFKLALRRKWRRQKNNTGQMTVFVPSAWSDTSQDNAHDVSHQAETFQAALVAVREAHASETATLREQLAVANSRADQAVVDRRQVEARADQAEADRRQAEADRGAAIALADQTVALLRDAVARADRAEAAVAADRSRADTLRDRLTTMQDQLADAHASLQAAELAESRVAAAEGRADRAEQAIAGERDRAAAALARLDAMQEQLAAAAEAEDQARRQRQAAQDNADAMREADAARRGLGRLARLRAAWRGE
jgi:chromosome segregation ATPase